MSQHLTYQTDERIEKIFKLLVQYTTGNFLARESVSDKHDELDAIILGLNTLAEEMQSSGKTLKDFEKRINIISEALLKFTLMDFSVKLEISENGDELDAIAVGLNTLTEELKASKEIEEKNLKQLEEKAAKILELNIRLEKNIMELETANRELEAFTYSVSHDLRAPLRAIHSYTKILAEEYCVDMEDEAKSMMSSVIRNAKKMGQLIDDLLAFSKIGKRELQFSTINMPDLVSAVISDLNESRTNPKTDIRILDLPPVKADYNLITLVITNLVSNAIKYSSSKENPKIEIGSFEENHETVYFVKDNGVGFDMQYYNKLFGVFQRLHSSEEFEGTGVGLALVKRIIDRHGGKVWANSEVNKGSEFYFTLNTSNTNN